MKRIFVMLLAIVLLFSFTACSTDEKLDNESSNVEPIAVDENEETENEEVSQAVEVDEGLLDVTITLPATYFEDEEDFDPEAYSLEQGFKKVVVNEDGSVSITMTKKMHKEVMDDIRLKLDEAFEELIEGENTPYIMAINPSDDYKKVVVDVDKAGYEDAFFDMTPLTVGILVMTYQQYDGCELYSEVIMCDVDTGDVLDEVIYPDAWDEIEEESE